MNTQGAFNLLFRGGLRRDFRDVYNSHERQYPIFLRVGRMDGPEIEATIMTGMRRLLELGDGEPLTFEDPVLGPKVIGVDKEFGLGFQVSKKTVEDDKYNKMRQSARWLGHAANMTFEYRSGAFLDDAFTGTTYKGIDSLPLCHTAHTLLNSPSGATWANRPSTEFGFSVAGINALLNLAENAVDHNGDPITINPDLVIYNPSQISKAIQIFGSDKEPFTANNQDNAIPKRLTNVQHMVKRFVTNTTSYHLVQKSLSDAHFLFRRRPVFEDSMDFITRVALFGVTTRFLIWFVDPRGWFGANPS